MCALRNNLMYIIKRRSQGRVAHSICAPAVREQDKCLPGSSQLFDGRQDRQRVNLSSLIAQILYLDWGQEGLT